MNEIILKDNSGEILKELKANLTTALTECGMFAQDRAAALTPVKTNWLRGSITNRVVDNTVFIGTDVDYGVYVEFGTGKYASNGNGRPTPWFYYDDDGVGHWTAGMKPHHMLKRAVADYVGEYEKIIKRHLKF